MSEQKIADIRLSRRLQAVADMVTEGRTVCDVGCDHGFVSIYLILKRISPKVIAMDVKEGPLQAAKEHIQAYCLTDYIETRLSDGVASLKAGEAETLICAGMGGRLMIRILEEGKDKLREMKELILQPQSELQAVREYLRKEQYEIADENMVYEEGKYYPMLKIVPKKGEDWGLQEVMPRHICDKYGPILLRKKNPVLEAFLHREYGICQQILENLETKGNGQDSRQEEIRSRIKDIERALSYYGDEYKE